MKVRHIILPVLLASVITACQKAELVPTDDTIVILLEDASIGVDVDTKATPVTSIPSTLYWGATTGGNAAGSTSETVKWATASASVTNNMISTGKFLPASPSNCNYYVANQTFTAGGNMTVSNNSTDIVCGRTFGTTLQMPTVVLNHIFARTGALTLNVPSGYTATSVSWRIKSKGAVSGTAGTYNVRTQSWTAASSSLADQAFTASSDLWLIPGIYTVTVSFTLTKGAFSKSYTEAGDVTLSIGKQNNITATTTTDEAGAVTFGVSLSAWSDKATNLTAADFN